MNVISTASEDDLPRLVVLLQILFRQEADFQPNVHHQAMGLGAILASPQTGIILVARSGSGDICGMVSLLFTISTAEGGPVCWLEDMIVHPDYRRKGIGSRLLEAAIDHAKTHGFLRITLLTDPDNVEAHQVYKRHGFVNSDMSVLRLRL
jgi:GNAT superfamily N-acetyltransferase